MRSSRHWKRNAKNADLNTKEKSLVAGIALILLALCALAIMLLGLEPISETEKVCTQAQFMHGGVVKHGECH